MFGLSNGCSARVTEKWSHCSRLEARGPFLVQFAPSESPLRGCLIKEEEKRRSRKSHLKVSNHLRELTPHLLKPAAPHAAKSTEETA